MNRCRQQTIPRSFAQHCFEEIEIEKHIRKFNLLRIENCGLLMLRTVSQMLEDSRALFL